MTNGTEDRNAKWSLKELLKGKESKFARYVVVNSAIIRFKFETCPFFRGSFLHLTYIFKDTGIMSAAIILK
jgi:hypothetical protein